MSRHLPNWIQGYLTYTAENESPEEFHIWAALSAIAGVIRRRAFFDMGYFLLYPNLYVVFVAPAGRCKKSTAMRMSRTMIDQVPGINFTTDSITRERLIQDLTQCYSDGHSSMTSYSSEFASLLTSSGMDMVVFLTDIFDSPNEWSHKTKMGGINTIKAPYLNLIGATTPDWIAKAMPLDTIGIGLTSRIIFVYQDTPRIRDPFPTLSDEQKQLKNLLIEDLQVIAGIEGEYTFDADAMQLYRDWYKERIKNPNPIGDPRLNGYFERKPIHLIKTAMLVRAAKTNDTVMNVADLEHAFNLLEVCEEQMPNVFKSVGKNPLTYDIAQVQEAIAANPKGIAFRYLMNMFKHSVSKEELYQVLDVLVTIGEITKGDMTPDGEIFHPVKKKTE